MNISVAFNFNSKKLGSRNKIGGQIGEDDENF
jgi:hypothetical protein